MGLAPYGDPGALPRRDRLALHPGREGPVRDSLRSLQVARRSRQAAPARRAVHPGAQGPGRRHSGSPGDDGLSLDRGRAGGDRAHAALPGRRRRAQLHVQRQAGEGRLVRRDFRATGRHRRGRGAGRRLVCGKDGGAGADSECPLTHVYLGRPAGPAALDAKLRDWAGVLEFEACADICGEAAQRLSAGAVLGWVQGRSEFGPRALGNRSIVADPRPAENKDRVNLMVKKREAYRPFAPSVLSEHAGEYFEIPDYPRRFAFMNFAVAGQARQARPAAGDHARGRHVADPDRLRGSQSALLAPDRRVPQAARACRSCSTPRSTTTRNRSSTASTTRSSAS